VPRVFRPRRLGGGARTRPRAAPRVFDGLQGGGDLRCLSTTESLILPALFTPVGGAVLRCVPGSWCACVWSRRLRAAATSKHGSWEPWGAGWPVPRRASALLFTPSRVLARTTGSGPPATSPAGAAGCASKSCSPGGSGLPPSPRTQLEAFGGRLSDGPLPSPATRPLCSSSLSRPPARPPHLEYIPRDGTD
jgi:hypothetical protein